MDHRAKEEGLRDEAQAQKTTANEKQNNLIWLRGQPGLSCPAFIDYRTVHAFLTDVNAAAARACAGIDDPGVLQLVFIAASGTTTWQRFQIGQIDAMTDQAVKAAEERLNVYIEGRTVRADTKTRGPLAATVVTFALVLDRDADKGMAGEPFAEPSLAVQTSPGNFHHWLMLAKAISGEDARQLGTAIRRAVGADNDTGTITQPYRVAGTPNFPSAEKIARGRVLCKTSYRNGSPVYSVEQLYEMVGPIEEEQFGPDPDLGGATGFVDPKVEELAAEPVPNGKRSTRFSHTVKCAVEANMTADDLEAVFRKVPAGLRAQVSTARAS